MTYWLPELLKPRQDLMFLKGVVAPLDLDPSYVWIRISSCSIHLVGVACSDSFHFAVKYVSLVDSVHSIRSFKFEEFPWFQSVDVDLVLEFKFDDWVVTKSRG